MSYQDRYLAHQKRKKKVLVEMMKQRHSTRVFADKEVENKQLDSLIDSLTEAPSSCDRHGIYTKIIKVRDDKAFLGGTLVGGVGWIHRAPVIVLLFADPAAYVEGQIYMPYLDAGVVLYHLWLKAESLGLKAAYINPNIRGEHELFFRNRFGNDIFCGALGVGYEEK